MAKKIRIAGVIIPNDYKWFYDYFDEDSTCPRDVADAIADAGGEELQVEINSGGGEISSGSEIYTLLRDYGSIKIRVTGQACSAASVIAMAGYCEMAPTSLMMVHCVSSSASGNHATMERAADMLRAADQAMCSAYCAKAGMSEEDALAMMERETWLTPTRALEYGLIDGIMFEDDTPPSMLTASLFQLPSEEKMEQARKAMEADRKARCAEARAKAHFLKLKGEQKNEL